MSFAEMKEALATLTPEERAELQEHLHALEEGVTFEELREINAMIDEELNDPSPRYTIEEVRKSIRTMKFGDGLELEFTARARRDIRAIVSYIARQNRDMLIAERFGQKLVDTCERLTKTPQMGGLYQQRARIQKLNEGAYKILY